MINLDTANAKKILQYLQNTKGEFTSLQIAENLRLSHTTVKKYLKEYALLGYVRRGKYKDFRKRSNNREHIYIGA